MKTAFIISFFVIIYLIWRLYLSMRNRLLAKRIINKLEDCITLHKMINKTPFSVEINGKTYPLQKEVFDLLKATSIERDTYKLISNN